MFRIAVARAASIVGHPLVLLPIAALVAASQRGAPMQQLWFIGVTFVALGIIVMGYSWVQVRSGRWAHVDASVRTERKSLNIFLALLCFAGAALQTGRPYLSVALALSGALISIGLLTAPWAKMSLHTAFAAFATSLLWPNEIAVVIGLITTAIVVWSRLILGRHVVTDVVLGFLAGAAAGVCYQLWGM